MLAAWLPMTEMVNCTTTAALGAAPLRWEPSRGLAMDTVRGFPSLTASKCSNPAPCAPKAVAHAALTSRASTVAGWAATMS